jgi:16S rRNA (uracil1498-N3)-methyltransferase
MIRLYCPEFDGGDQDLHLGPDQSHYLKNVMRRIAGDEIALFNAKQGEWRCKIIEIAKKTVILSPLTQKRKPDLSYQGPVLIMALINRQRLETVIEKATELGVSEIALIHTRRSKGDHANLSRLQAIAIEAAEQTERIDVPRLTAPKSLKEILETVSVKRFYFADEDLAHKAELKDCSGLIANGPKASDCAVIIGPEGGFDDSERIWLRGMDNAASLSLGPRILRSDTAAIAALTILQALSGDWWPHPS